MTNIAQRIITKLGGHQKVADMLKVDVSQVYRWTYPKARGGTDGFIPTRHLNLILNGASQLGVDLSPADFFDLPTKPKSRKR